MLRDKFLSPKYLFLQLFINRSIMSLETNEILERLKKITLLEAYELVKQIL